MRYWVGVLITSIIGCSRLEPANQGSSDLAQGAAVRAGLGRALALVVGQGESVAALARLTPVERASLTISVETLESSLARGHDRTPVKIPFITWSPASQNYTLTKALQKYSGPTFAPLEAKERLATFFSSGSCASQALLPYHPETQTMHPVVKELMGGGALRQTFHFEAFPTMSRSLFVLNNGSRSELKGLPTLFTVKMGTDRVNRQDQPQKLVGLQEEVAEINEMTDKSAIPRLMETFGVTFLLDAVGINVQKRGASIQDDGKNYGVILRDYTPIVQDRDYLYMPLETFKWKAQKVGNFAEWRLDDQVTLRVSDLDLARFVLDLSYEQGKFEAILLSSGFAYIFFHTQNVLVGLPLRRELRAKLGFRDVGDSHEILPDLTSGRGAQDVDMKDANWCTALRHFPAIGQQCMVGVDDQRFAGFRHIAVKLGFALPGGLSCAGLKRVKEVTDLLSDPQHATHFARQVASVRSSTRSSTRGSGGGGQPVPGAACPMTQRKAMLACMASARAGVTP